MPDELVLTFPRTLLDEIGSFQGLCTDIGAYVPRILEAQNTRYVPRSLAEDDPVAQADHSVRAGPARRHAAALRARQGVRAKSASWPRARSGIGGHINHRDEDLFGTGLDFYEEAVQRELHEELLIDADLTTRVVALINDDSTPVGQVHFGVVHVCELGDEHVSRGEPCITDLRFLTLDQLRERRDAMETWSQLSLDFVLANPGAAGLEAPRP